MKRSTKQNRRAQKKAVAERDTTTAAPTTTPATVVTVSANAELHASTVAKLKTVLLTETAESGGGLPVLPLLELIAAYAMNRGVETWVACRVWKGRPISIDIAVADTTAAAASGVKLAICCWSQPNLRLYDTATVSDGVSAAVLPKPQLPPFPHAIAIDHGHAFGLRVYVMCEKAFARIDGAGPDAVVTTFGVRNGGHHYGFVIAHDRESLIYPDEFEIFRISLTAPYEQKVVLGKSVVPNAKSADPQQAQVQPFGKSLHHLVWDRAPATSRDGKDAPSSIAYGSTSGEIIAIETAATPMSYRSVFSPHPTPRLVNVSVAHQAASLNPCGLASTVSGHLLFSCQTTQSIWSYDPREHVLTRLAGQYLKPAKQVSDWESEGSLEYRDGEPLTEATFLNPHGLALVPGDYSLAVADCESRTIRRLPLAGHYFTPRPKKS